MEPKGNKSLKLKFLISITTFLQQTLFNWTILNYKNAYFRLHPNKIFALTLSYIIWIYSDLRTNILLPQHLHTHTYLQVELSYAFI